MAFLLLFVTKYNVSIPNSLKRQKKSHYILVLKERGPREVYMFPPNNYV